MLCNYCPSSIEAWNTMEFVGFSRKITGVNWLLPKAFIRFGVCIRPACTMGCCRNYYVLTLTMLMLLSSKSQGSKDF